MRAEQLILHAQRVIFPQGPARPGWVQVRGSQIVDAGPGGVPDHDGSAEVRRLGENILAPGLVDMHVHGGGGAAFTEGGEAAQAVLAAHRARGTTSMVASLVTDTINNLERQIWQLVPLCQAGELAGIHLEGPWLSPRRCGAHDPDLLIDPNLADLNRLLDAGDGHIRMVTLAPERPGASEAIKVLHSRGVVAAVGHTDASDEQTEAAIHAGATVGTHLFNALPSVHHRKPGPIPQLLSDPTVVVELIADGVHVHPSVLRMAVAAAQGRFALITDAMSAAGKPDGSYRLGPLDVDVVDGVARIRDTGAIAGSTLTLDQAVQYAIQTVGVGLEVAVRAASSIPAQVLGLAGVGRIQAGARADLVVFDAQLNVQEVLRGGVRCGPEWDDRGYV
ncbi:N-acetylglucosamine-6-phosphate deacetylase [Kocuria sp.]|uniref:N-acetylglucosamine-6-phosphate deacetylase n=1 Tax=Kocuria sp. TaxID=1871328 RepID=UPI0026E08FE1|nr:N-acetylglucosamine-6-phosphate deacetylase [Kocuria sp.]MDO5618146.1 N-acetylglucosamine-6-phosphate deacetylase [Kocuria sp.]